MAAEEGLSSLEFTPTWIVAVVCFGIVLISLCVERSLHKLGQLLHRKKQDALYAALEKLKGELMLLGFISLLLTVFQNVISKICIPSHLSYDMLPCKRPGSETTRHGRRLMNANSSFGHCHTGKIPLLSLEALHHLHIFIFVLAVVHVVFCVTTMVLGGAKIRQWKNWEESIKKDTNSNRVSIRSLFGGNHNHDHDQPSHAHLIDFLKRAQGFWRKASLISWMIAFFKQFYGSVTKSDYIALRHGFIKKHFPSLPGFDFHKYMLRTLEVDFRKIVGISWYLWFFVVLFLLLNIDGWNAYFWLSFLPLILLLIVGAKLEHIIIRLAEANAVKKSEDQEAQQENKVIKIADENENLDLKPSDEYFWFGKPGIVLILIHFILFQNSFEIAFFFWIWSTYGFQSCIMEKTGFMITRVFIGIIVQVLCSYSTLPLYALVTQMGNSFKKGMFKNEDAILGWLQGARTRAQAKTDPNAVQIRKIDSELSEIVQVAERPEIVEIYEQDTVGFSDGDESTIGIDHEAESMPSSSY